ncbi:MAG: SUMF1/EgtB/PvdO family nonheme iron enzyme [Sphaerospermopsis kisseleviana]
MNENDNYYRLLRGGSWDSLPQDCRSALRLRDTPVDRDFNVGFRVVCGGAGRT